MHLVLVNRLGGLSLPWNSVVRKTDRPDITITVYRGRRAAKQQRQGKQMDKRSALVQVCVRSDCAILSQDDCV